MRIVLSRKGFDSGNGGIPSPIMPDGTLLSLPIPSCTGTVSYHDLMYQGKTYYEIIEELSPATARKLQNSKCHVDPDLIGSYIQKPADWKPAFGQCDVSQLHLQKYGIGMGDMFLFYGWFRQTKYDDKGRLHFVKHSEDPTPDRHVIYGYMEVGEVITNQELIANEYSWHPHAVTDVPNNVLYCPKDTCSLNQAVKGYGILKNAPIRQLTKHGCNRSEWDLPDCLKNVQITYHENNTYGWIKGANYFKSAHIGQEFIIRNNVDTKLAEWLLDVITPN